MTSIAKPTYLVYGLHLGDHNYRYVGMTSKSLETRLWYHIYDAKVGKKTRAVCHWIRKHGGDAIQISLLQEYSSIEDVRTGEIEWIDRLGTYRGVSPDGLNLTLGGEGVIGWETTPEIRKSRSERILGDKNPMANPEYRKRVSEGLKGHPVSEKSYAMMKSMAPQRNPGHYRWHVGRDIVVPGCTKCDALGTNI